MTFVSHAQNFEDVLLWRALGDVPQGRYIDIGAHDPVVDSVSLAFYQAGWRGLHVEPIPAYAAKLRDARPEECVIEAVATDEPGPILLYELGGLSSGRKEIAELHARNGYVARQLFVPAVRLDHLMTLIDGDIHWLKIDVEGMEAQVLRSWGKSTIRPWIIVIEATVPNSQESTQHLWIDEVLQRGYERVFFDGLSCYLVHKDHSELKARISTPANVFDGFEVSRKHFASGGLRGELESLALACQEKDDLAAQAQARIGTIEEDIERQRTAVAEHIEELDRQRSAAIELQSRLTDAERGREDARNAQTVALESLASAERQHRSAIEDIWLARQTSERELRQESTQMQATLLARVEESEAGRWAVTAQLARLEERASLLQDRLTSSEHERARLEERASLLQDRLTSYEHERARLDALIRRALMDRPNLWRRLGQTFGLSGPSQAWIALGQAQPSNPTFPTIATCNQAETSMQYDAPMNRRNPYLRADSLLELLSWHDVNFVRCAYVTILGRQPDPEGEAYFVDRIRRGRSKMEVLWHLRTSAEGSRHDPGISGLDRALRSARRARARVFGAIFRMFTGEEGDSAADRRQRAIANDIGVIKSTHRMEAGALGEATSKLDRLENQLQTLELRLSGFAPWTDGQGADGANKGHSNVRSLLDPIDLSSAKNPDEAIELLKSTINTSREAAALHSERPTA